MQSSQRVEKVREAAMRQTHMHTHETHGHAHTRAHTHTYTEAFCAMCLYDASLPTVLSGVHIWMGACVLSQTTLCMWWKSKPK